MSNNVCTLYVLAAIAIAQNAFLTCSWRFLISNKLEQLQIKLEKNIGIEKHAGKVRKYIELLYAH